MEKELSIERPYRGEERVPWDDKTRKSFEPWDVEALENGEVVFIGRTAYSLEDKED